MILWRGSQIYYFLRRHSFFIQWSLIWLINFYKFSTSVLSTWWLMIFVAHPFRGAFGNCLVNNRGVRWFDIKNSVFFYILVDALFISSSMWWVFKKVFLEVWRLFCLFLHNANVRPYAHSISKNNEKFNVKRLPKHFPPWNLMIFNGIDVICKF